MLSNRSVATSVLVTAVARFSMLLAWVGALLFGLIGLVLMWYAFGAAFRGDVNLGIGAGVLALLGFGSAAAVVALADWLRGLTRPKTEGWDEAVRRRERMREEASWPQ